MIRSSSSLRVICISDPACYWVCSCLRSSGGGFGAYEVRGEVRKVWPDAPEVMWSKFLARYTTTGKSFNSGAMFWREWADAICPRGDIAQIAVTQGICKCEMGPELLYCEVSPIFERVFFVVHSESLICLDIDVKPN